MNNELKKKLNELTDKINKIDKNMEILLDYTKKLSELKNDYSNNNIFNMLGNMMDNNGIFDENISDSEDNISINNKDHKVNSSDELSDNELKVLDELNNLDNL
tara:strand:- start:4249 stop:4557 length:309 start_codon:yes stop_codon:yes gene_type:complete